MIAMQMGNKNMIDLIIRHMKTPQLMLSRFSAINKKMPLKYIEYLSGRISVCSGNGRTTSQYSQLEFHDLRFMIPDSRFLPSFSLKSLRTLVTFTIVPPQSFIVHRLFFVFFRCSGIGSHLFFQGSQFGDVSQSGFFKLIFHLFHRFFG